MAKIEKGEIIVADDPVEIFSNGEGQNGPLGKIIIIP